MALEPITRQEKIIAGQDLTPITRMEKFLKQYRGGSGGVTSWNELEGKPFVTVGGDTLTWDGNTDGNEPVLDTFYKVSDTSPTLADLANGYSIKAATIEETAWVESTNEHFPTSVSEMVPGVVAIFFAEEIPIVFSVVQEAVGVDLGGVTFSEAGLYFNSAHVFAFNSAVFIRGIKIPGYTGFTKEQIDPAVLPESPIVIVGADDTMKLDKTLAEIQALRAAGKTVLAMGSHISVHSNGDTGEITEGAIVMFDATTTGSDTNVTGVALTAQVIKFAPDGSCIGMVVAEVPSNFLMWLPVG